VRPIAHRQGPIAAATVMVTAFATAALVAPAGAAAATHIARTTTHFTPAHQVVPRPLQATPDTLRQVVPVAGAVLPCQQPGDAEPCFAPHQLRAAYRVQPLLDAGVTGKGRTIVIVDAFAPPGVGQDLRRFDKAFGLADPLLTIVAPDGAAWDPTDADQSQWSGEIDLDLQLAHVVAPGAALVLVEAKSDEDADIASAVSFAVQHNLGDVISMSFYDDERCLSTSTLHTFHATFEQATARGITLTAASGDLSAAQFVCDLSSVDLRQGVGYPAADPLVLGVGGTELHLNPRTGGYGFEKAWNDGDYYYALGSGGGYSRVFGRPGYQDATVARATRGVPDVSYSAAGYGGAIIYWGQDGLGGGFYTFEGTSLGTPQWAGLVVLADQVRHGRLGFVNPVLYRAATTPGAFHDVRYGNNDANFVDDYGLIESVRGYPAAAGWDPVTGLGSPIATAVVPYLASHGRS
jgi:subtilase family serine protease